MLLPALWPEPCQRYNEDITLASDRLSGSLQTLCVYARRSQRKQSFVSNIYNNTDLVIARTSPALFRIDDRIRHPSHQDKIWRQNFRCCWTARVERSSRRYKEHYRLAVIQTSHKFTAFYICIFRLNSFTFLDYYIRRFWIIFILFLFIYSSLQRHL